MNSVAMDNTVGTLRKGDEQRSILDLMEWIKHLSQDSNGNGHKSMVTSTEPHLEIFAEHRSLLFGIAWRMVGNPADAEDIMQEGLVRWLRVDLGEVRSARAFLVTMVTRLCLNHLDLVRVKKETPWERDELLKIVDTEGAAPAQDADLAEALDSAFSVLLKCLSPQERAVFLLREVFESDYSEIARILEKSEDNCRQILSRARERIAGRSARYGVTGEEQDAVLKEFLSATETGDLNRLLKVITTGATLYRDGENLGAAPPAPIEGAKACAEFLATKLTALVSSGVKFQQCTLRSIPLLLAYRGDMLVTALALVFGERQIEKLYLIHCPIRLRSVLAQLNQAVKNEFGMSL